MKRYSGRAQGLCRGGTVETAASARHRVRALLRSEALYDQMLRTLSPPVPGDRGQAIRDRVIQLPPSL